MQGIKAGFYTFNHFKALYGTVIGLYGAMKNDADMERQKMTAGRAKENEGNIRAGGTDKA